MIKNKISLNPHCLNYSERCIYQIGFVEVTLDFRWVSMNQLRYFIYKWRLVWWEIKSTAWCCFKQWSSIWLVVCVKKKRSVIPYEYNTMEKFSIFLKWFRLLFYRKQVVAIIFLFDHFPLGLKVRKFFDCNMWDLFPPSNHVNANIWRKIYEKNPNENCEIVIESDIRYAVTIVMAPCWCWWLKLLLA